MQNKCASLFWRTSSQHSPQNHFLLDIVEAMVSKTLLAVKMRKKNDMAHLYLVGPREGRMTLCTNLVDTNDGPGMGMGPYWICFWFAATRICSQDLTVIFGLNFWLAGAIILLCQICYRHPDIQWSYQVRARYLDRPALFPKRFIYEVGTPKGYKSNSTRVWWW